MARAALDDVELVGDPVPHEPVERQRARHPVDQREHVRAERVLQLRVLVEVVEDDLGDGVALEHDDQALAGAPGGLVADVGDTTDAPVLDELGDLRRQVVRVDLVRKFGDDEARAAVDLLDLDHRAHGDGAATRAVRVLDAAPPEDRRRRREVRSLHALQERLEQLLAVRLRVLEVPLHAVRDLAQVVRRDVGRHADGDAGRAVDQQVREPARQDLRLLRLTVVVVAEVDGVLVDVPDHLHGQGRHAALRVPGGGCRVVAGGPEVALAGHERVPHRPVLHQADEGVVDRAVAVRVELAHDVADDARALGEGAVRPVPAVVHRVQHPPVHRLEAVAHVRQRTPDDDRHGVDRCISSCRSTWSMRPCSIGESVVSLMLSSFGVCGRSSGAGYLRCRGTARPWRCAG